MKITDRLDEEDYAFKTWLPEGLDQRYVRSITPLGDIERRVLNEATR